MEGEGLQTLELPSPQQIRARALGVALLSPSIDELCYRIAVLSIGLERMADIAQEAAKKASQEEHLSLMAIDLLKQLEPMMAKGKKFSSGRKKGSISKAVQHIHQLAKDNRRLSSKELLAKANKKTIGDMSAGVFSNHVTNARKKYPKEK
jgi:hypothetical protein